MTVVIEIEAPTAEVRRLWTQALELARALGAEERWTLVGGLMVQLHAFEHDQGSRLTTDIDLLGDSRRRPAMTAHIAEVLKKRGAEMALPPVGDEKLGYRFEVEGSIVEILGSEGMRDDPPTLGKHTAFQVPGGTQALKRTEVVGVSLDGATPVEVRRPSLLGAILIKARIVKRQRDKFESDRQDLIRLLSFVDDPRALAREPRGSERRWLRDVEEPLAFDDRGLVDLFAAADLAAAEGAYRLLLVA